MRIHQLPAFSDNYIYLLEGPGGQVAVVDAGESEPVEHALIGGGLRLSHILNTHHHRDHVGANLELKARYGCVIFGSASDAARIPGMDQGWRDGDTFLLFGEPVEVLAVDGHTRGHIAYYLPESRALFSGDVIFSLGCGKLFEGTAREMWASLARLRALPPDTRVFGAHEYTLENAIFAQLAEPGNQALSARVKEAQAQRARGEPTVPTTLALECATNPFLRPESPELRSFARAEQAQLWEVFGALREAKDRVDSGHAPWES